MKNRKLKGEPIPLVYYGRHNLPQVKTKIIPMSTIINRDFYKSLRKRGSTHIEIMNSIQPERYNQFLEDVTPVIPETTYGKKKSKISWWSKFKLLFTILLLVIGLNSVAQDATPIFDGREIYADTKLSKSKDGVVSIVSTHRDTLYLVNNAVGYEIEDVWCNYEGDIPVIIFKSPEWLMRENNIRKGKK